MNKTQARDMTADDRTASADARPRSSAPARATPARRKWSARRTLVFIVLASVALWALIIAMTLRS
jgi:hypothetical protein